MIDNIVVHPNHYIMPENTILGTGKFEFINLQFVPIIYYPTAQWTENGVPYKHTPHSKWFVIATPAGNRADTLNRIALATHTANQILSRANIQDSVIIEHITDSSIDGVDGWCISGSFVNLRDKRFVMHIANVTKTTYFALFGVCHKNDTGAFFNNIDLFRKTVRPY